MSQFLEGDFLQRTDKKVVENVRNSWCWSWLDTKDYNGVFLGRYIRKLKKEGYACCITCQRGKGKELNYGEGGRNTLVLHSKTKKHKDDFELQKNATLPSYMQLSQELESGSKATSKVLTVAEDKLPYGTLPYMQSQLQSHLISGSVSELRPKVQKQPVSLKDRTAHMEAMICTFLAEHSLPLSLGPELVELCRETARDVKALDKVSLSRRSTTRKLVNGIHAVEQKRLVQLMKTTPFSLNIDESTVKSSKKRILNVLLCLYDDSKQKSVTYVYRAIEMWTVTAQTVYEAVHGSLAADGIPMENLISILSDSAAYMRGRKQGFQKKMKDEAQHILDIDGDTCHHVHNIVKHFAAAVDGEKHLASLLDDVHNDFKFSADLRETFHELAAILKLLELLPVERTEHRWLSLLDTSLRLQKLLRPLTVFYFAWLSADDKRLYQEELTEAMKGLQKSERTKLYSLLSLLKKKNLTDFGKARKVRITRKLFNLRSKTLCLLHFFCDSLQGFKRFILAFEQSTPMVHKLHDRILELNRTFLSAFVKPEHLSPKTVVDLDLNNSAIFKAPSFVTMSHEAVAALPKNERKAFHVKVHLAYISTAKYMQEKLPLKSQAILSFRALDPCARGHQVSTNLLNKLGNMIPTMLHPSQATEFKREVDAYQIYDGECPSMDLPLDKWWAFFMPKFPVLGNVVKACLSVFTGPRVEQSFSFINSIIDPSSNRMSVTTYEAVLATKYRLINVNSTAVTMFCREDFVYSAVDSSLVYHIQTAWKQRKQAAKTAAPFTSAAKSKPAVPPSPAASAKLASVVPSGSSTKPAPSPTPISLPAVAKSTKRKQTTLAGFFAKKPKL